MNVGSIVVRMPDLDMRISNRAATAIENSSAQISDSTDGGRDVAVNNKKIVIRIQRQRDRIIRTLRLLRSSHQSLSKSPGYSEESSRKAGCAKMREETSAIRFMCHARSWTRAASFCRCVLQDLTMKKKR